MICPNGERREQAYPCFAACYGICVTTGNATLDFILRTTDAEVVAVNSAQPQPAEPK